MQEWIITAKINTRVKKNCEKNYNTHFMIQDQTLKATATKFTSTMMATTTRHQIFKVRRVTTKVILTKCRLEMLSITYPNCESRSIAQKQLKNRQLILSPTKKLIQNGDQKKG